MGAEYEHLKKPAEALWHYQRVMRQARSNSALADVIQFGSLPQAHDSCLQELGEEPTTKCFWGRKRHENPVGTGCSRQQIMRI